MRLIFLLLLALSQLSCTSEGEGADPGIADYPVAYAKRIIPLDIVGNTVQSDIREPLVFTPGGDLYIKDRASASASERNITQSITLGLGDVRDISPNYDGDKILFSLKLDDPDPNDDEFFTWNIYEYDLTKNEPPYLVIDTSISAEEGDDISPQYLPDGRIVFVSNRQTLSRAILLDEGLNGLSKPQFSSIDEDMRTKALVLHVMEADGSNIRQITFNQSHDLDPSILDDGRILFSRWDNAANKNSFNLYTVHPDGSNLQSYYGTHAESHIDSNGNIIELTQPKAITAGHILALTRPFTNTFSGGDLVIIDTDNYVDINQPTTINQGILFGPAQNDSTVANIVNNGDISPEGRYSSAFPLRDGSNRLLVSKGTCQLSVNNLPRPCINPWLSDPAAQELMPNYGIWIYDLASLTEKPLVLAEQGAMITQAVSLQPSIPPSNIPDKSPEELDDTLVTAGLGQLHIRSVYDVGNSTFNGCYSNVCSPATNFTTLEEFADPALVKSDQRPARFIRIVKPVGIPERNDRRLENPPNQITAAFGPNIRLGMREIIAYKAIEPDGSIKLNIPANIPFAIEILDSSARRIGPRHDAWLQLKPGETLECNGCHTHAGNNPPAPHGRTDALSASINAGALYDGYEFPNSRLPGKTSAYFGDFGETMAEAKSRLRSDTLKPDIDVIFIDDWSNPDVTSVDTPFNYTYTGTSGLSTTAPAEIACDTNWTSSCRTVINYTQHISPLWNVDRGINTCTSCHNKKDIDDINIVPIAQLDLSSDISDENNNQIESYRELLFPDNGQELDAMGNLIDSFRIVPVLDSNGDPLLDIAGNPVTEQIIDQSKRTSPSMSQNGARVSYFIEKLTETEINATRSLGAKTVNHAGLLSKAELRLISEWLDLGAQYFNNPFDSDAPSN